ncbi:hypothetical protein [Streptomyces atroolivaceus]
MRLDWIRWTMRTGPLVDARIEHPVGYLGLRVLEDGFVSSWRAPSGAS